MLNALSLFGDTSTEAGQSLLREQYRSLREQIPIMYGVLFVNSASLSLAVFGAVPTIHSLGVPLALSVVTFTRMIVWLRWRHIVPTVEQIHRSLATTFLLSVLLSIGFVTWGLFLFPEANLVQRTCIGLFVFISAISCAFCLQSFPAAARAVLYLGGVPLAIRALVAGDWFLVGIGLNVVFVTILIHRIVATNYAGFIEVLSSRSSMLVERERAREAERQAHELAYHDPLTSLPNRRALSERLDQIISTRESHAGAALMIVDLDRFKDVNDVHGHLVGDALLADVARKLQQHISEVAEAFRLGGDEFAIVSMLDRCDRRRPERLARELVDALAYPIESAGLTHHVGASIGIARFPYDAQDRETLMRKADIALYDAKTRGKGRHRMFQPAMDDLIRFRSSLEMQLRSDVKGSALTPFLQPIVDLSTREVVGFELLARWCRKGQINVGPEQFIPLAEECGLINELMLTLLSQGCAFAQGLGADKPIAINISPVQLKDPQLAERILDVLATSGFPARRLGIEITENGLVADSDRARRTIQLLKTEGVQVALDDFGTGYSSLRHLHLLPFDKIKIDRSFVSAMTSDREAFKIVRAIINLAGSMGLCVVAEGVESEEVARQLERLGCTQAQGFHFGRPAPARIIAAQMRRSAA